MEDSIKKNKLKMQIAKNAMLLGWNISSFDNDTMIIKKNKLKLNSYETNTEFLLLLLTNNKDFDISLMKKIK